MPRPITASISNRAAVKPSPTLNSKPRRGAGSMELFAAECHDMIDGQLDADLLADGVIMVRWHQRQCALAARQLQRVEEFGAAEGLVLDFRQQQAVVVVDDVVGTELFVVFVVVFV